MANKNFRVRHGLEVAGDAALDGDLKIGGNDIKASDDSTAITLSGADVTVAGDLKIGGNDIKASDGTTAITLSGADVTVAGNLTVSGTTTTLNTENLLVEDNIVVLNSNVTGSPTLDAGIEVERGTSTNSALTWDEDTDKWYQDRAGVSTVIPVSTSELAEGTNEYFTQSRARQSISVTDSGGDGSLSYDNSTGVITYTGPSASEVRAHLSVTDTGGDGSLSYDNSTGVFTYTGPSASEVRAHLSVTDTGGDGSLSYDNSTGVFTYTGPSASEVRAHFSGGTGVTITDGVVAIGQSVGTGDSPTFAGVTAGNLTVGLTDNNTITSTNTNGDITLDPNGSGEIILGSVTRLQGEMQASTNLNYAFPAQTLATVTDNNGYSAVSSMPAGTNGYGANAGFLHYFGDTLAGTNTTGAFVFRSASGNSTTDTVPFTGIAGVAPSAVTSGNTFGTLNYNGYGTTGFVNDVGTSNQGGGINAVHNLQIQGYAAETLSDSTLTLTSTAVTAVASSFRSALGSPSVTGTKGQISFNSTTPGVGNAIRVTGTLTGTATGIVSGNNYWIIATNGSTTATLSATPGGSPIDTTAGTLTGLTLTRCGVTFTTTGQTSVPFGRGAKVTVANVTNVTDGTYPVFGTPSTTSFGLGIPHTVAPTLPGTQTFSCTTTYGAGGLRVRSYPAAVPMNQQNRLEILDMTPAATTVRSDSVTFAAGSYGNTGATMATLNSSRLFHSVAVRGNVDTGNTVAKGATYTPAATELNYHELEITNTGSGTGVTLDVTNWTVSGEGGMYAILVYNNSGSAMDITLANNGVTGSTLKNLANGDREMVTVYCVGNYASAELMTAIG